MGPTTEYLLIDPDMAADMLRYNTRNRKPSSVRVNRLASLHGTDLWKETGDTIKFAEDGTLLDGQHRLLAIIKSGIPQWYLVARGISKDAQMVMDTNQTRTFGQHLQIEGVKNATYIAATTKGLMRWDSGSRALRGLVHVSNSELWRYFKSHEDEIVYATTYARSLYNRQRLASTLVISLLTAIISRVDEEDATFFMERLFSDFGQEETDPISQLRRAWLKDRMMSSTKKQSVKGTTWQIGIALKAWNLFRKGERVQTLTFRQGGARPEVIPEPI